jgi:hypothetical protein
MYMVVSKLLRLGDPGVENEHYAHMLQMEALPQDV